MVPDLCTVCVHRKCAKAMQELDVNPKLVVAGKRVRDQNFKDPVSGKDVLDIRVHVVRCSRFVYEKGRMPWQEE